MTSRKPTLVILLAAVLAVSSCAALQPPSATGPKGAEQLYPILLTEDSRRKEAVVAALNRLAQTSGLHDAIEPQLHPITGTILSLPAKASTVLFLPKVGSGAVMNEEETREALRRFISTWQEIIGSDPAKLSLVDVTDQPDGSKLANYEQRPFRYPIRGDYGKLQIRFTNDRRLLDLMSTCIPDAERIQNALSALGLRPKAEDSVRQLREKGLTYSDAAGNKVSLTITPSTGINPRTMTIYVLSAKNKPETLEFHLTWEMELSNAPVKLAYVDAVSGEVIAAQ